MKAGKCVLASGCGVTSLAFDSTPTTKERAVFASDKTGREEETV
jgi:hypothetical protein